MTLDKNFVLDALIRWNYLPTQREAREELPPVFCAGHFTVEVAQELAKLDSRKEGYDQVEYRLTRFNNVSRPLSLPHPLAHAKLCFAIHANWEQIEYIADNPSSGIKPQAHADGRLIIMDYEPTVAKSVRLLGHAFGKRFKIHTDISNCFPSIYSHAVPWALVGFPEAKSKKPPKFKAEWFNQLDENLRLTKRNETQGIAIGPGTSNVMSEIILARIDKELRDGGFTFVRYIDDYTCHCDTEDQAQDFIRKLAEQLSRYKLLLNIRKTEVKKLPAPLTTGWMAELVDYLPSGKTVNPYQALQFLDKAVALSNRHPEGSVLKFAFKALIKKPLDFLAQHDVLRYGLVLSYHNPVLLPLLEKLLADTWVVSAFDGEPQLNTIIQENARLHRSDGMCWGLYLLSRMEATVVEKTAIDVISTGDALSILMLYWTGQHTEKIKAFCETLNPEDPYELDCYWLLLYQLFFDDVCSNPYGDGVFEILKGHRVTFYDSDCEKILVTEAFSVLPEDEASMA